MLTKTDLNQISKIVDKSLDSKLDLKLKPIKKDIAQIRKDQKTMLNLLDKEQMEQRKRIIRLEEHVGLPNPQQ